MFEAGMGYDDTGMEYGNRKVKLPAAGVMLLLYAIYGIAQYGLSLIRLREYLSQNPAVLLGIIPGIVRLSLLFLISALLLMKKRNGFLAAALSLFCILDTVRIFMLPKLSARAYIVTAVFFFFSAAAAILIAFFSFKMLLRENEEFTAEIRKFWFLPALLMTAAGFCYCFSNNISAYSFLQFVTEVLLGLYCGTAYFLLCRWLAFPYAEEKPAAFQNGQEFCQTEYFGPDLGQTDTFCPFCGEKISENTVFCPFCGRRIPPQ